MRKPGPMRAMNPAITSDRVTIMKVDCVANGVSSWPVLSQGLSSWPGLSLRSPGNSVILTGFKRPGHFLHSLAPALPRDCPQFLPRFTGPRFSTQLGMTRTANVWRFSLTPKALPLIAQGCEALRATLGKRNSSIVWATQAKPGSPRSKRRPEPRVARKASQPWAMRGNTFGVENENQFLEAAPTWCSWIRRRRCLNA